VNGTPDDFAGKEFTELLMSLDLQRPGVSFYALGHSTETIAGAKPGTKLPSTR